MLHKCKISTVAYFVSIAMLHKGKISTVAYFGKTVATKVRVGASFIT